MGYRIAVDVGGTFTDVVAADDVGRLTIGKGLTTRERIFRGLDKALPPWRNGSYSHVTRDRVFGRHTRSRHRSFKEFSQLPLALFIRP